MIITSVSELRYSPIICIFSIQLNNPNWLTGGSLFRYQDIPIWLAVCSANFGETSIDTVMPDI